MKMTWLFAVNPAKSCAWVVGAMGAIAICTGPAEPVPAVPVVAGVAQPAPVATWPGGVVGSGTIKYRLSKQSDVYVAVFGGWQGEPPATWFTTLTPTGQLETLFAALYQPVPAFTTSFSICESALRSETLSPI